MVNSRLGRFAATPNSSSREGNHRRGHSFSRSYGVSMPSSLTMVLPIALVCSTRLPVSVLVRAPPRSLEVFLGSMGSPASHEASSNVSAFDAGRICLPCGLRAFTGTSRTPPGYPSPSPRRNNAQRWYRNVRLLCIGYACRPRLSSRLTLGGLALPRNP